MAQWINFHQNDRFVNQIRLLLLWERSGAIFLVLVGLKADRKFGWMKYW